MMPPMMPHFTSGRRGFSPLPPKVLHEGVSCDRCHASPLAGVRYKCVTCPDYDLCSQCVNINDEEAFHPASHVFFRIAQPSQSPTSPALQNRSDWVHKGVTCHQCHAKNIVGFRYFCTSCGVSICEGCEMVGVHDPSHPLLKMAKPSPSQPPRAVPVASAPVTSS